VSTLPDVVVHTKSKTKAKRRARRVPPYHIILENDNHHSFEFVVNVLRKTLGCSLERAFQLTELAHSSGEAVIWTGPKEVAELKVEQIRTFREETGASKLGPLGCRIEPAPTA
jgi:ATP-dependent Clp protease adaptor protein ClpS